MTITVGAMPIAVFCQTYGVGRTKTYDLINSGAVSARKCGKTTLIDRASAERWYASLPSYGVSQPVHKITASSRVEAAASKLLRS
jgi:hypothetical protein